MTRALLLGLLPLVGVPANAVTLRVPADYATIQAGMDQAAQGDTVLVAPGTYSDSQTRVVGGFNRTAVVFLTDGVVLLSEAGPEVTTIDMQGQTGVPQPNVVRGEDLNSGTTLIEGFTITGNPPTRGAVSLNESAWVTFVDCIVRDVTETGISARHTSIRVQSCQFTNCQATSGGAIGQSDGDVELYDSWFENCSGRAVRIDASGVIASALVSNCTFLNNTSPLDGGGISVSGFIGGGLQMVGCHFEGNVALGSSGGGASLGVTPGPGPNEVRDCVFLWNTSLAANSTGGGLHMGTKGTVVGNTFYGNSIANDFSGAAVRFNGNNSTFSNNIVAASSGAGAVGAFNVTLLGGCNVFWNNVDGNGAFYTLLPDDQEVDPLFCDPPNGDFTVAENSPCLPAQSGGCGQIGALPMGCGPVSVESRSWGSMKANYR